MRVQTVGKSGKDKSFARRRMVYDEALLQEHEAASECASVRLAGGTQRGRLQTAVPEGWRERDVGTGRGEARPRSGRRRRRKEITEKNSY